VPTADNLIQYKISGNGRLLGLDNGDPADHEPYQSGKEKYLTVWVWQLFRLEKSLALLLLLHHQMV